MTPRDNVTWRPFKEPLRITLIRNGIISLILGAVLARWLDGFARWPLAVLLMLWPSFGGHLLELWFLNWLCPRLPAARAVQVAVRLVVWFLGGIGLGLGMKLTAILLNTFRPPHWPAWWVGGVAFIGIELLAHLGLLLRKRPSFYTGQP